MSDESKHDVSKKALKTLETIMFYQDDFGMEKYKKPLKHTYKYNWMLMLMEELADAIKYAQNEMDRKQSVIKILEYALEHDEPKHLIETALEILKTEGTGK